jgi:hypothetical protein
MRVNKLKFELFVHKLIIKADDSLDQARYQFLVDADLSVLVV